MLGFEKKIKILVANSFSEILGGRILFLTKKRGRILFFTKTPPRYLFKFDPSQSKLTPIFT